MGIDQWRNEQAWPLPDTRYVDYHLDSDGRANTSLGNGVLSIVPPSKDAADRYLYDPRRPVPTLGGHILNVTGFNGPADQAPVEKRDDVLTYSTPPLKEAIEVTGPVAAVIYVSSDAPDTDFTAKLVDVFPDGRAILLCEGVQRMRYRHSLTQPELMSHGEVYQIRIDMTATSNVFLPGHRIRVEISSSNFPRYDRNSNTGGDIVHEHLTNMVPAINQVHHGPDNPSRLVLPINDRT
jgi:putative CocE/NonD family hydrolase